MVSAPTTLEAPQGRVELLRRRHDSSQPLRAWDAADEYLLAHLDEVDRVRAHDAAPDSTAPRVLVLNDSFGALAVALAFAEPVCVSDSVVSQLATRANLQRNGLRPDAVRLRSAFEPFTALGDQDVVVMRVPLSLAQLEDQLHRLRPLLHPHTEVVAGGMTKHVHNSTIELFERIIGPTPTSPARKKARLLHPAFDPDLSSGPSPHPTSFVLPGGHTVVNHAGVFSAGRVDQGTQLLLDHLRVLDDERTAVDLGCGSGVIALHLAMQSPELQVLCVDASYAAVASAGATFDQAFGDRHRASFDAADGLEAVGPAGVDLVVTNPPFHADRSRGDAVAWRFFQEARHVLRPGGRLVVVGNRHLGYHAKMRRLFGNVEVMASDPKFVALASRKRR